MFSLYSKYKTANAFLVAKVESKCDYLYIFISYCKYGVLRRPLSCVCVLQSDPSTATPEWWIFAPSALGTSPARGSSHITTLY